MSRLGIKPIQFSENVEIDVGSGVVKVSGPVGEVEVPLRPEVNVRVEDGKIFVGKKSNSRLARSLHGTMRMLLANAVAGVQEPYEKRLVMEGLGYRSKIEDEELVLDVGFANQIHYRLPPSVDVSLEGNQEIVLKSPDKEAVGRAAAEIRQIKPPEPYKGTGIRYKGEEIKRKVGKAVGVGEGFGAA
ncbi:MAG: 50S ribosomal protein L6 [Patescibacteria group bacterium]